MVLENCTFHKPAMKWTINYLKENLKDKDHTAYFSKDRQTEGSITSRCSGKVKKRLIVKLIGRNFKQLDTLPYEEFICQETTVG